MTDKERRRAAARLAGMLYEHLEIDLKPSDVERFVVDYWSLLAPLAHTVHGGVSADTTKMQHTGTWHGSIRLDPQTSDGASGL